MDQSHVVISTRRTIITTAVLAVCVWNAGPTLTQRWGNITFCLGVPQIVLTHTHTPPR